MTENASPEIVYAESSPVVPTPTPEATESPVSTPTTPTYEPAPIPVLTEPEPYSDYYVANYAATVFLMGTNRLSPRGKYKGIPETYRVPVMEFAAYQYDPADIQFAHMFKYITDAEYQQVISYMEGGYTHAEI